MESLQVIRESVPTNQPQVIVRLKCECGGEFRRIEGVIKVNSRPPVNDGYARRGYQSIVYLHQCDRCKMFTERSNPYPRIEL